MKNIFLLCLFALALLSTSCPKKDNTPPAPKPDVLPPITQTGANTFGFMLNGKVWLPHTSGSIISLDPQYYRGRFTLSAERKIVADSVYQYISWGIEPIFKTGIYIFDSSNVKAVIFRDSQKNITYYNSKINNQLEIPKLDSANRIISGTFNIHLVSTNNDTLNITNGRFDLKFTY